MTAKTVYFANAGLIDLNVIRVMGVSVKVNANPIGYFGTGLKFAIATLVRTGHQVTIVRAGIRIPITAQDEVIRSAPVKRLYLGDEKLPFTTELGRNWEVWQAYRELHSNTLDEAGEITDMPVSADTVIEVSGTSIYMEFINRDQTFVSGKPLAANAFIEVYPGPSRYVYYRGVRAGVLPKEAAFRYNFLCPMTLTEDRTFESQFTVEWKLAQLIPTLDHKGIHHTLLAKGETWDGKLSFSQCGNPSDAFLEVARQLYSDMSANAAARVMVDRDMQSRGEFPAASLNDHQHSALLDAFPYLLGMGCTLSPEDVDVVTSLGPSCMAIYHKEKDRVFLAVSTLDCGLETVIATLYEEWLHKVHGYQDESRELQTFLFQRIAFLATGKEPPAPKAITKVLF